MKRVFDSITDFFAIFKFALFFAFAFLLFPFYKKDLAEIAKSLKDSFGEER